MKMLFALLMLVPLGVLQAQELDVAQAFTVKQTPVGDNVALLGRLFNPRKETIVLMGASTPVAAQVVLQRLNKRVVGKTDLANLTELPIASGEKPWFVPEDLELRLLGVTEELRAGREFPLLLKLNDGTTKVVRVTVVE